MSFGKAFFSSCLGALAAMVVFFFLCVVFFISMIASVGDEKQVALKDKSVLFLQLDAQITELQRENPLSGLPIPGGDVRNIGVLQLKEAIAHAKEDEKIEGIYLEAGYPMTGFSSLEEI